MLRRSNRKRKFVSAIEDMSKSSGTKKKKASSPDTSKSMPKLPRTPMGGQEAEQDNAGGKAFEAMLMMMEARLGENMEKVAEAAQEAVRLSLLTKDNLEKLDTKVDKNESSLRASIKATEERLMERVDQRVKEMVDTQLRSAGFDPELSAADFSVRRSVRSNPEGNGQPSYAGVTSMRPAVRGPTQGNEISRTDRQETSFLNAQKSLRLWPIPGGSRNELENYLRIKLRFDEAFIREELGEVVIKRPREPKNKIREEFIVTFESKQIRDTIKAAASNLANFREEAGMRLHVPDHLQRDFQRLMNLSYDLKKRYQGLKRNIKFGKEDRGLFMDLKLSEDKEWKRVKPEQAAAATKGGIGTGRRIWRRRS